jgi:serine/threonine protein kinase
MPDTPTPLQHPQEMPATSNAEKLSSRTDAHGDENFPAVPVSSDWIQDYWLEPRSLTTPAQVPTDPQPIAANLHNWPSLPGYDIIGELGRGGMGVVYKALDVRLKRFVAIKMLLDVELGHDDSLTRFRIEGRAAARLQHPNIVQIHEVGDWQNRPYLVMEYVEGTHLAKVMAGKVQHPYFCAELMATVARAMDHAHQQGVLHRDLKPSNILLTGPGLQLPQQTATNGKSPSPMPLPVQAGRYVPKITDFGLAKLYRSPDSAIPASSDAKNRAPTRTGILVGTPQYMSPEQATLRGTVTPASDIHALGVILYEMLTGKRPFDGYDILDILLLVRTQEPLPLRKLQPRVPKDLETICLKCLAKEPKHRYATAGELAADLERFAKGEPILARPLSSVEKSWRWMKRYPARAAVGGITLLAAAVILGLYVKYSTSLAAAHENLNVAYQEKEVEYQRAEKSFHQAQEAVERFFVRVTEADELRDPATAPLRERLLKDALNYFEAFLRERGPDSSLQLDIAKTQERIARIWQELGKLDKALEAARQGRTLLVQLQQQKPEDKEIRRQLGKLWRTEGWLLYRMGKYKESRTALNTALEWQRPIVAAATTDPEPLTETASTYQHLGIVEYHAGNLSAMLHQLAQCRALYERCLQMRPADLRLQRLLAGVLHDEGAVLRLQGKSLKAQANFQRAVELQEKTVQAQPHSRTARTQLANHHTELSSTYFQMGEGVTALHHQNRAVELTQENVRLLTARQPEMLFLLSASIGNRGNIHSEMKRYAAARQDYEEAIRHQRAAVAQAPQEVQYQLGLALQLLDLQGMERELKNFDAAERALQESQELLSRLAKQSPSVEYANFLAVTHLHVAKLRADQGQTAAAEAAYTTYLTRKEELWQKHRDFQLMHEFPDAIAWHANQAAKAGKPAAAVAEFQKAVKYLESMESLQNWQWYNFACYHARCAELLAQTSPGTQQEHVACALTALEIAFAAGFKDLGHVLDDNDLACLHTRMEFWLLVQEQFEKRRQEMATLP